MPKKQQVASDIVPPVPKIKSLQAITRLRPVPGCAWNVIAFVLNSDMILPDGKLDDFHGLVFCLGSFNDEKSAHAHAKNIIEVTGHPAVTVVPYGLALKLTTKFDPNTTEEVYVDNKGKIIEMENALYKEQKEKYEKRLEVEREIMDEVEEEKDPNSIEYFKRQCYLAIKNRASYHMHTKEADSAWENYKKREALIREHYGKFPQHEKEWLPMFKKKLIERGESDLYFGVESAYKELRDELLGLEDFAQDPILESDHKEPTIESIPQPVVEQNLQKTLDKILCECGPVCEGSPNSSDGESIGDITKELNEIDKEVSTSKEMFKDEFDQECIGGVCINPHFKK